MAAADFPLSSRVPNLTYEVFFAPFSCIADFCGDARFRTPRLWCGVACGVCFDTFAVIFHKQNLCFQVVVFQRFEKTKIQGTYFKISALYFKNIWLVFFTTCLMFIFMSREA